jgi:integrase
MSLTDLKIRTAKPADKQYKLSDSGGLYLLVKPNGARLWRLKYRLAGKENVFAIGEYPAIALAEARQRRDIAKKSIKEGANPAHTRQTTLLAIHTENATTFESVAREWIEKKKPGWTPYYLRQVEGFLKADVFPFIGLLPIRTVTAALLLDVITRAESRGAETVALLIRQWCSAIFRYAVATLRADHDPAAALRGAIHRPKTVHKKPLTRDQISELLKALEHHGGYRTTVIAMRLMLLTFVRTVELRAATWSEFDLGRAEWRIPAERMKMRELHIVPLPQQAIVLLIELQKHTGNGDYLFPNRRTPNTCMTGTTLNRALERMGFNGKGSIGFSGHGFRATASTMLNEMGYRSEVIERQLAHAERNKVRASYNQAEYMEERRSMMQQWADFIDAIATEREKEITTIQ